MASSSDVLKQGYVQIPGKKLAVWKKRWLVLRRKSAAGSARLEKYREEANFVDIGVSFEGATVLELRHVEQVTRIAESVRKYGVLVIDNCREFQFAADSEVQANQWVEAIKEAVKVCRETQNSYKVHLLRDVKLKFNGECTLFVSHDSIQLFDIRNKYEIISWPFKTLRRYGVERNHFQIEAGRSSETGEGVFNFESEDPEAIYQCVHSAAKAELARSRRHGNRSCNNTNGTINERGRDHERNNGTGTEERFNYQPQRTNGRSASSREILSNNYTFHSDSDFMSENAQDSGRRQGDNYYRGNGYGGMNREFNDITSDLKKMNLSSSRSHGYRSTGSLSPQYSAQYKTQSVSSRETCDSDDGTDYLGSVASYGYSEKLPKSSTSSRVSTGGNSYYDSDRKALYSTDYSGSDINNRPLPPNPRADRRNNNTDGDDDVYDTPYADMSNRASSNRRR